EQWTIVNLAGRNNIELWIGKNRARVNGTGKLVDSGSSKVVFEIINGRTMLPLRFKVDFVFL
ncbi:MAG: stalk domain-containing protein, partial [Caldisericaceae bacterium]